jgi:hypothetical protein
MPGFPAGFLTLLFASESTNSTSTTSLGRSYCPIECLDHEAAMDAVFCVYMSSMAFWIVPQAVKLLALQKSCQLGTKRLVQELALTPKAKREAKLQELCEKFEVEYMEVEDDGQETERKYGGV